ncbi:MFS transporter [Paenibacillus sp. TC-CSREp1]|uniref:MFS transporter n=1 Tax=Paenibacillus sp. TC-CSREp1 TaxID=3410089 RepID=UPI003CFBB01D
MDTEKSEKKLEETLNSGGWSVLRNKTFLFYLYSIIFTSFTGPMYMLVEGWYVVDHLNQPALLGLVLMVTAIPRVLFMLFGGVLSDRISKSKIMFFSDFTRAGLLFGMAGLVVFDLLNFWTLLTFAALFGVLEAFYWPASTSIIPSIVPAENLRTANSFGMIIQQLGMMLGPVIAGLLLAFGTFEAAFTVIGVLLLLGALCLILVRVPVAVARVEESKPSMFRELKEGFLYIKKDSFKVSIILTVSIASFFVSGPVSVAFPTLVKTVFEGTTVDLTYLQTSFAIGSVLGGVLIGVLKPKGNMAVWAYGAFILLCVGIMTLGLSKELNYSIVISIFTGLLSAIANMMLLTVFQLSLEQDKLGRGMSLFTIASMGLYPLSAGLVPLLLSIGVSISTLLVFSGAIAGCILTTVLFSVKTIRNRSTSISG